MGGGEREMVSETEKQGPGTIVCVCVPTHLAASSTTRGRGHRAPELAYTPSTTIMRRWDRLWSYLRSLSTTAFSTRSRSSMLLCLKNLSSKNQREG
jgi:hypothetical protein